MGGTPPPEVVELADAPPALASAVSVASCTTDSHAAMAIATMSTKRRIALMGSRCAKR
jgi:hypothetical protein